ncbi:MAG: tetratricopeptide repeat protein [Myxococcota bacterium]
MRAQKTWKPWAIAFLLGAAALAAHGPALSNDFVAFDDPDYVRSVPQVMSGLRAQNVLWAFTSVEHANWFPVTRLSWILDAELFGRDPAGFHATSIALHVFNVLLFFAAIFRLTRDLWPSAFVAAVFAVHPLHVESVTWIATRKDVLSGLFFAISLLFYERKVRGERPRVWGAALAVAFALGLMSKPMLVTLPFLLLLLDVWPLGRWRKGEGVALFREKAVLFGLSIAMCVVTLIVQQGSMASVEHFPAWLRIQNASLAYVEYVQRAVWPTGLIAMYPLARSAGNQVFWSGVVVVLCTALAVRSLPSRPWYFVGWFWYVGVLFPVIGLVQVGAQATADRYTYLALAGLSIFVAWGVRDLLGWLSLAPRKAVTAALGVAAVLCFGLLIDASREQVATWKNERTLWLHALTFAPHSYGVRFRLALALHDAGDYAASVPHYEYALRLAPDYEDLRVALERAREGKPRKGR